MATGRTENLKPFKTVEEARENGKKGGIKSGESRRKKRELKARMKALLEMPADPKIAAVLEKTGVDIEDNLDVLIAAMVKGVLRGDARMIEKVLEITDQNPAAKYKLELQKLEKKKAELEAERLAIENEKNRLWLDSIKGVNIQENLPDDGFIEALKGTATEDWDDDI